MAAAVAPPMWGALEEAASLGHTDGAGDGTEGQGAGAARESQIGG